MRKVLLFLLFTPLFQAHSEVSEAFIVLIYDKNVKVISPAKLVPGTAVILENRSLNKIYGKVLSSKRNFVRYVGLEPEDKMSIDLDTSLDKKFSFVSMAPAFQAVNLLPGKKSYEIPAKE